MNRDSLAGLASTLLRRRFHLVLAVFAVVWAGAGYLLWVSQPAGGWAAIAVWMIAGWPVLEALVRLFLRLSIGRHHRHWLFGYLLVDDAEYGFRFRPEIDAATIPFPIFDRAVFPAGTSPSNTLETNRSQRLGFTTNTVGYRSTGAPVILDGDRIRIVCMGGSTTACTYCADDETWPAHLQQILHARGVSAEVINTGVLGWSSNQDKVLFEKEIIALEPDIALLHQGWNEEFLYSSLGLGRHWRPGLIRNVRESYHLYTAPGSWAAGTRSLAAFLAAHHWYRNIKFTGNMGFDNPARWEVLATREYLLAWFDNLVAIAGMAARNGIRLYTMKYPGLTGIGDLPQHRRAYIEETRLNSAYADYQAVSRQRINLLLDTCADIVPCIDIGTPFDRYTGTERLALFEDEIHLSAAGNKALAGFLADRLEPVMHPDMPASPVPSADTIAALRKLAGRNPGYLTRLIDRYRWMPEPSRGGMFGVGRLSTSFDIPQTRYTTW